MESAGPSDDQPGLVVQTRVSSGGQSAGKRREGAVEIKTPGAPRARRPGPVRYKGAMNSIVHQWSLCGEPLHARCSDRE